MSDMPAYFECYSKIESFETAHVYSKFMDKDTQIYELDSGIWLCRHTNKLASISKSTNDKIFSTVTLDEIERPIIRGVLVSSNDVYCKEKIIIRNGIPLITEHASEASAILHRNDTIKYYKNVVNNSKSVIKIDVRAFKLSDNLWIVRHVLDIIEEDANEYKFSSSIPDIKKGVAIRSFSFGRYGAVLYKNCPMLNVKEMPFLLRVLMVKYRYVFCVFMSETKNNELIVTHEKSIFGSPFLCAFTNDGKHVNYGEISSNISEEEFLRSAFELVNKKYKS